MIKYITAVDLVVLLEKCSKQEAKRLLKSGAVAVAENENATLEKVTINTVFEIECKDEVDSNSSRK